MPQIPTTRRLKKRDFLATGTGSPLIATGPRQNAAPAGWRYGRKEVSLAAALMVGREGHLSVGRHERSLAAG